MTFEEWLKTVVKVEALRLFVDNAPDGSKRARLEELLHAHPESLAMAHRSYNVEAKALNYSS